MALGGDISNGTKDNPLQYAGSFQAEGLGISLVEKFSGNDFAALVGLPLIQLTTLYDEGLMRLFVHLMLRFD